MAGPVGERRERMLLATPILELDAERRAVVDMSIDAFVREIEPLTVPVEELPERLPAELLARLRIAAVVEDGRHRVGSTTSAVADAIVSSR